METNQEPSFVRAEELIKLNFNLEFEINKLKTELKLSKQQHLDEIVKLKGSYEGELAVFQESNVRNKLIQETLENENKTIKAQLVSYQLKSNTIEKQNEELKKCSEAAQSSLHVYEEKINQFKQTVQSLNEKFNERNKIEIYLSKNVNFALETNKNLRLTVKHHDCIVENYRNVQRSMEERINQLNAQNESLKTGYESKSNEYVHMVDDLKRKLEKTQQENAIMSEQLQELTEYKLKAQQSIDNSSKIINENSEIILKNKQEIKELRSKLDESLKSLNITQANAKQLLFDTNSEINNYKQQVSVLSETIDNLKKSQADVDIRNEALTEQLYMKEFEIHELKQFLHEIESKKLNCMDNYTQTYLNNIMFDKYSQTLKTQTFDTFTQTLVKDNSKPIVSSTIAIQCDRLVFTKDISTQTELQATTTTEQALVVVAPSNSLPTPPPATSSGRYLDNKLNDLLKHSFNNYTNRCLKNKTNNNADTTTDAPTSATSLLKLPLKSHATNRQQQQPGAIKTPNENYNYSTTSSKRVRFSEATLEIDDIEENDFLKINQHF